MPSETSKNHLPKPLRDSNLPWKPQSKTQAAAPRPGDSWTATLGGLEIVLLVDPDPNPIPYELFLYDLLSGKQLGSESFESLKKASLYAENTVNLFLSQIQNLFP